MCSDLRDGPGLAHLLLSPVDPWQFGALPGALDLHETAVDGLEVLSSHQGSALSDLVS